MCSLLAEVENGRVLRIKGDPEQPFTAGFACAKVNRDAELVHSPERLQSPLRRVGPKGEGKFAPVGWDEALDEITGRWRAIIAESGPLALLGYAYSAHQGQLNRGLMLGLFHALGASRLIAGTVCDTCCEEAWNMTVGPVGGADPEAVDESDLIVSWGADLVATNVHFWAKAEAAQKRGVPVIVIDPRRSRTAKLADWHLQIRIGTDAALALGIIHILVGAVSIPPAVTGWSTVTTSPPRRSASTGSKPRCCRALCPKRWRASQAFRLPMSSASPRCTVRRNAPSSASAKA